MVLGTPHPFLAVSINSRYLKRGIRAPFRGFGVILKQVRVDMIIRTKLLFL